MYWELGERKPTCVARFEKRTDVTTVPVAREGPEPRWTGSRSWPPGATDQLLAASFSSTQSVPTDSFMSRCPHWPLAFMSHASDSGHGCGNVPRRPATAEPGWQASQDNVTPRQTPHPTHPQPGSLTADPRGPLATPKREVGQRTRGHGKKLWLSRIFLSPPWWEVPARRNPPPAKAGPLCILGRSPARDFSDFEHVKGFPRRTVFLAKFSLPPGSKACP